MCQVEVEREACPEAATGSLQVGSIQGEPGSQCCVGRAGLGRLCRRWTAPHVHQSAPAAALPQSGLLGSSQAGLT